MPPASTCLGKSVGVRALVWRTQTQIAEGTGLGLAESRWGSWGLHPCPNKLCSDYAKNLGGQGMQGRVTMPNESLGIVWTCSMQRERGVSLEILLLAGEHWHLDLIFPSCRLWACYLTSLRFYLLMGIIAVAPASWGPEDSMDVH